MKTRVLLTGATGYIGGLLLKLLEADGFPVRCITRRPESLQGCVALSTEIVAGDVLDADSLQLAMGGVHTAYYLVHTMDTARGFEETDRQAVERFSAAARARGVQRIICLGGLGDSSRNLSAHLRSRHDREHLQASDVLDCWCVEAFEPGLELRLAAGMKMPGRAGLEFEGEGAAGGSIIRQTAIFDPVSLWGHMYRYLVYPLHQLVFA
jgi:NAD(P)-dependent dehydrogenase (short-subunit alcohol dehydrogenase family)